MKGKRGFVLNVVMVALFLSAMAVAPAAAQEPVVPVFDPSPLSPAQGEVVWFTPTQETLDAYPVDSWQSEWVVRGPYDSQDPGLSCPLADDPEWIGYPFHPVPQHFTAGGWWQVCVQMEYLFDPADYSPTGMQWIQVANLAPEVWFPYPDPFPVMVDQPFQLAAVVDYADWDIDGNPLTTCTVDWGEQGRPPQPGQMLLDEVWGGLCVAPSYVYKVVGSYTFTVTATDPDGSSGTSSIVIQVVAKEAAAIVSSIQLSYKAGRGGTYTLTGLVTITDGNGNALNKAVVGAEWTLPDGTRLRQQATTNRNGGATFRNAKDGTGAYTLCVTGVTKAGYTFLRGQNDCKTVPVP